MRVQSIVVRKAWWQEHEATCLQEGEMGQEQASLPAHNDPLVLARLCLLKFPCLPEQYLPAGKQVFKNMSLLGTFYIQTITEYTWYNLLKYNLIVSF